MTTHDQAPGLQAALDMARVWCGVSLQVAQNPKHDRWVRLESQVRYEQMVAFCRALEALLRDADADTRRVVELELGDDTPTAVERP